MIKKELPSQEYLKEFFNYDNITGLFTWKIRTSNRINVGSIAGNENTIGYIQIQLDKRNYLAHIFAWKYYYGIDPINDIDHINGIRSDNRIENLREATTIENNRNRRMQSNNTSGYKGVFYNKRDSNYYARAGLNGTYVSLGYFNTPEEASDAYIKFTKEHFKEFYKETS